MATKASGGNKRETRTTKPTSGAGKGSPKQNAQNLRRRKSPEEIIESEPILDSRSKRDIGAVVSIVLAVVLFLLAILPSDALISGFASSAVHHVFGIGCYILPAILLVVAILFLWQRDESKNIVRIAAGCGIVFVALLAVFALFAPIEVLGEDEPSLLFTEPSLVNYGGYIGSSIDWLGIVLLGRVITAVIDIGILVIGCIVIGLSISSIIELLGKKASGLAGKAVRSPAGGSQVHVRRVGGFRYEGESGLYGDGFADMPEVDENVTAVLPATASRRRKASERVSDSETPTRKLGASNGRTAGRDRRDRGSVDEDATIVLSAEPGSSGDAAEPPNDGKSRPKVDESPETVESAVAAIPEDGSFVLPPMALLNKSSKRKGGSKADLESTAESLGRVLSEFGIDAEVVDWIAGPTVTLFEVDLPPGIRVSRITALSDDIALALASPGVRIFAPVPGTNYVGIEVPNAQRETVLLSDVLDDAPGGPLQIAIGKDVEGKSIVSDLARMPHLLIGGTTGSGKSVSINAMIMSILMRATPDEVRFIMIDPKRVEFTPYNGIPHLYVPVVTEASEAASALAWGVAEMERRLKIFSKLGVRNISQYNRLVKERSTPEEAKTDPAGQDVERPEEDRLERLPYMVIIIDELADLMMNVGKEVEMSISRIAQLARAAGIHLIVATQRPSTNVVTGLIKSNITNRIAFNVASGIDSRVILDNVGAEKLIGLGDLLLSTPELARPQRIQGCFVTEEEIEKVVGFVKSQGEPDYHGEILNTNVISIGSTSPAASGSGGDNDPLIWEAADIIVSSGLGSTSNIQRRLKVGYARAGRIMDQLEEMGIVGPANGSKPREVLVDEMELESVKAFETSD